jgi:hypothetical protein
MPSHYMIGPSGSGPKAVRPLESRVEDLRCCFTARHLVHSYASQREAPSFLCKICNGYQLCLLMPKGNAPPDSVGRQESPFVST